MARRTSAVCPSEVAVPDFITYIEIRQAILRHEFLLDYQPKVNLRSGLIQGVEALVRWQHSSRGRLPPDMFLPQIERAELISRLTQSVIDDALAQCAAFHRSGILVGMAVNVSPSAVTPDLPGRVAEALARHEVDPGWLTIEITETIEFEDLDKAGSILAELRASRVLTSIDDFGVGRSSLTRLHALPFDEIKLDRSIVGLMRSSSSAAETARAATELGHSLGLIIVAEGVEDGRTLRILHDYGIDMAQGYHFAPPLPAEELTARFLMLSTKAHQLALRSRVA